MHPLRTLLLAASFAALGAACGGAPVPADEQGLRTIEHADGPEGSEAPEVSAPADGEEAPPVALPIGPIAIGDGTHAESLDPARSASDDRGRWYQSFEYTADEDGLLRVRLRSNTFDAYLRVTLADGRVLENDDFGGALHSRLHVPVDAGDTVRIDATSYAPATTGPFTLEVVPIRFDKIGPLLEGDDFPGLMLDASASADPDLSGALHVIESRAGERLRVRVTSPDFDTVATLLSPEGHVWENDDANDLGEDGTESSLDSTIEAVAPVDGRYLLQVRSYGGNDGTYRVRLTRSPAPIVHAGEHTPRTGFAGSNARGRIFGVFVGISAYVSSPLPHCADDAAFIGEAFRKRRLALEDQLVILTDADATRANVEAALRELLPRAGADDVFFFFYSGHGATLPADGRGLAELNGVDETMELFDGPVRDHDFAALFDSARAGTIVLAMDSCHAGGFARDFVDRPGRVGLFSSDEDVLSLTAGELQSGGYLSWSLLRGILGAADRRPHDGALLLGELTDYLVDAYAKYHALMNVNSITGRHQRLVIQRGSVDWGTLLWMQPRDAAGALPLAIDDPVHGVNSATQRGLCPDGSCPSGKEPEVR